MESNAKKTDPARPRHTAASRDSREGPRQRETDTSPPPRAEIAIRLKDGRVLCSRVPYDTHCLFAGREQLDGASIESAGFVRGGEYYVSRSSAIGDYIRLAKPSPAPASDQCAQHEQSHRDQQP